MELVGDKRTYFQVNKVYNVPEDLSETGKEVSLCVEISEGSLSSRGWATGGVTDKDLSPGARVSTLVVTGHRECNRNVSICIYQSDGKKVRKKMYSSEFENS